MSGFGNAAHRGAAGCARNHLAALLGQALLLLAAQGVPCVLPLLAERGEVLLAEFTGLPL
jgi:hypothetical protein